jgi:hypothetical protein
MVVEVAETATENESNMEQLAEALQQLRISRARTAVAEARAAEGARLRREAEARAAEAIALVDGTFFAKLEDIWGKETKVFANGELFRDLVRSSSQRPVRVRSNAYQETITHGFVETSEVVDSTTTTHNTVDRNTIWQKDIFGKKCGSAEVAHLLPAASNDASTFWSVAICVFGLHPSPLYPVSMKTIQKLVHGSRKDDKKNRINHNGLKHAACNKIRFNNKKTHFDTFPRLLIVPVMTLIDMKNWNGEGYNAIVLAGEFGDVSVDTVYTDIGMFNRGMDATQQDVDIARKSLEEFVLGLAYVLHHDKRDEDLSREVQEKLQELRRSAAWDGSEVFVPVHRKLDHSTTHVRLISFDDLDCPCGHPAPDPLLLGAKAAHNWTRQNNQGVFAEPLEESVDDLSAIAEAQFLEDRRQRWESKRESEIMQMVIDVVHTDDAICT